MRSKDNNYTMQKQNHDHQALYPNHIPVHKNDNHEETKEAHYERRDTNHNSKDHSINRSKQKCDTRDEDHNHPMQDQIHDNQALHPNNERRSTNHRRTESHNNKHRDQMRGQNKKNIERNIRNREPHHKSMDRRSRSKT